MASAIPAPVNPRTTFDRQTITEENTALKEENAQQTQKIQLLEQENAQLKELVTRLRQKYQEALETINQFNIELEGQNIERKPALVNDDDDAYLDGRIVNLQGNDTVSQNVSNRLNRLFTLLENCNQLLQEREHQINEIFNKTESLKTKNAVQSEKIKSLLQENENLKIELAAVAGLGSGLCAINPFIGGAALGFYAAIRGGLIILKKAKIEEKL